MKNQSISLENEHPVQAVMCVFYQDTGKSVKNIVLGYLYHDMAAKETVIVEHKTRLRRDINYFTHYVEILHPRQGFVTYSDPERNYKDESEYLKGVVNEALKYPLFALDDYIFQLKEEKNKEYLVTKDRELMGFFQACRLIQDKIDELRQSENQ